MAGHIFLASKEVYVEAAKIDFFNQWTWNQSKHLLQSCWRTWTNVYCNQNKPTRSMMIGCSYYLSSIDWKLFLFLVILWLFRSNLVDEMLLKMVSIFTLINCFFFLKSSSVTLLSSTTHRCLPSLKYLVDYPPYFKVSVLVMMTLS